jgi:preprotein translocase subunit SecD
MAEFDTQLTLAVDNGGAAASATRSVLIRRLRREGILARIALGSPGELEVELYAADRETAVRVLLADAELRFMLVESELDETTRQGEVARIRSEQAAGRWRIEGDRYAVYPWHPEARGASTELLLVRTKNMLSGDDFDDSYRALDGNGRNALGFVMSPVGRKKLLALTSTNVGKQLAVVYQRQVRSAPEIRGAIGKKGIIEGGKDGWDMTELDALITLLKSGALPHPVSLVREARLGE